MNGLGFGEQIDASPVLGFPTLQFFLIAKSSNLSWNFLLVKTIPIRNTEVKTSR